MTKKLFQIVRLRGQMSHHLKRKRALLRWLDCLSDYQFKFFTKKMIFSGLLCFVLVHLIALVVILKIVYTQCSPKWWNRVSSEPRKPNLDKICSLPETRFLVNFECEQFLSGQDYHMNYSINQNEARRTIENLIAKNVISLHLGYRVTLKP